MLKKRIIPCLDVTEGRVVKGTNFVNLKDAGDPVELAKTYDKEGADELVFLDITATNNKQEILVDLVKKCAQQLFIPFSVGGGINKLSQIHELLNAGADKVSINSAAIANPSLLYQSSKRFGSQCIILAIDAKKINYQSTQFSHHEPYGLTSDSQWEVFTHGGRTPTGIDAVKWAMHAEHLGVGEILLTSMDKDGTKNGYDTELTKIISSRTQIPIIASGGAGNSDHVSDILNHSEAALLASILHFKEISIQKIKETCQLNKHPIRL